MNSNVNTAIWLPPEKRDPAWFLYHEIFVCNVRNYQTMSIDYVKTMGVNSSGDEELDRGAAMSMVSIGIPISKMMDYFERGINVGIRDPKDCERIYTIVNNHLRAWASIVKNSFNPGIVPVKDLMALDKFAAKVYPHAEPFFARASNRTTFASILTGAPAIVNRMPAAESKSVASGHRSLAQVFKPRSDVARPEVPKKKAMGMMRSSRGMGLNE